MNLARRALADGLGTALLLAVVVGSGIMGERLSGGNDALALLANSLATGLALVALILAFDAVSGAHFNPVVTLALVLRGRFPLPQAPGFVVAQFGGALLGVFAAHAMFDLPIAQLGEKARHGPAQWWSELVATFGLVFVVLSCGRRSVPFAVGAYIAAAYWFTASTSFANPAVTLARGFTNSFSGIRLQDVAGFAVAQVAGTLFAVAVHRWFSGSPERSGR